VRINVSSSQSGNVDPGGLHALTILTAPLGQAMGQWGANFAVPSLYPCSPTHPRTAGQQLRRRGGWVTRLGLWREQTPPLGYDHRRLGAEIAVIPSAFVPGGTQDLGATRGGCNTPRSVKLEMRQKHQANHLIENKNGYCTSEVNNIRPVPPTGADPFGRGLRCYSRRSAHNRMLSNVAYLRWMMACTYNTVYRIPFTVWDLGPRHLRAALHVSGLRQCDR
jgi:hypothetical protein